jgi:lysophospholipase L1-like esterase
MTISINTPKAPPLGSVSRDRLAAEVAASVGDNPDLRSPKLLRTFHTALANVANAPCDVFVLGDSVAEGADVADNAQRWQALVMAGLRDRYQPSGVAGGIGYIPATKAPAIVTSNWPWSPDTGISSAGSLRSYGLGRKGSSVTVGLSTDATFTFTGTRVRVYFPKAGRESTNPAIYTGFYLSVDGGPEIAVPTNAAPPTGGSTVQTDGWYWDSGALTAGAHTMRLYAGTNGGSQVAGVFAYNGDETAGIRFWDSSRSGAMTTTFSDVAATWPSYLPTIAPSLVLIELGANDSANAIGIDVYKTNLAALVATFRANRTIPPSIVFVTHAARSVAGTWQDYLAAMREVAVADGDIALFDVEPRFGDGDEALAAGLKPQADTVHLTALGARLWSNALVNFLLP